MRLLKLSARGELSLPENFVEGDIPPYTILSHIWSDPMIFAFAIILAGIALIAACRWRRSTGSCTTS
jgi:hypothetical protein